MVARGLGNGKLKKGSASATEGAEVDGMGNGEGLTGLDELLRVPLAGFTATHHFLPVYPGIARSHLVCPSPLPETTGGRSC